MSLRPMREEAPEHARTPEPARGVAVLSTGVTLLAAVAAGPACHPAYRPPTLNEPHATLKTRVIYHQASGPQLQHRVLVNDAVVDVPTPPQLVGEIARAILVRPAPTRMTISAMYFHTAMRMQAVTESYSCGTATNHRTCTRTVWRSVPTRYPDGTCDRALAFAPAADGVYLTQFDYFGPEQCSFVCFRELVQPDGSFRHVPCEQPVPGPPPS